MRSSVLWRVLGSQALSSLGTSMTAVALAWMVLDITGSVLHFGAILAVTSFPLVVTSWFGGAVLDRFNAKYVMIASDAARAVLICLMPLVANRAIWSIYVIAGLIGVFSAAFNPGQIKLVGELAGHGQLVKVNSYLSISRDGAELVGYMAGGVLVAAVGYAPAFFTDGGSYMLSALLLLGLPGGTVSAGKPPRLVALIAESPAVFGRLWKTPSLRTNLLMAMLPLMFIMMNSPNSAGLIKEVFGRGPTMLAVMEVAMSCGLIVGGLAMSRMTLRADKNKYVFGSFVAAGACMVGIAFSDHLWLSILLLGIGGVVNVGMFVPAITMFQEAAEKEGKGRLISLRAGFGQAGAAAGFLIGGVLGEYLGIKNLFLFAGVAAAVFAALIYLPYAYNRNRRVHAAWSAAMAGGATRVSAREAAYEAALGGADRGWATALEGSREFIEVEMEHEVRKGKSEHTWDSHVRSTVMSGEAWSRLRIR